MKARTHNRTLNEIDEALKFSQGHFRAAARLLGISSQAITNAVVHNHELARWRKPRGYQPFRLKFRLAPEPDPDEKKSVAEILALTRLAEMIKGVDRGELIAWLQAKAANSPDKACCDPVSANTGA
jgi:hypothetical protein